MPPTGRLMTMTVMITVEDESLRNVVKELKETGTDEKGTREATAHQARDEAEEAVPPVAAVLRGGSKYPTYKKMLSI